ncbi:MAG: formate dehydrogenase accessory sulfurtransferase FdhD [Acidobacteriota bacterium]|nr:formate dehydrogenase accessory sulfurtransferase FdhD [Acidobacteriota bacterium]
MKTAQQPETSDFAEKTFSIRRVSDNCQEKESAVETDTLAIEEPLEIRLGFTGEDGEFGHKAVSVTMRTPGNDFELAAGFLFTEGVLSDGNQISSIKHCGARFGQLKNTVRVDLQPGVRINLKKIERNFYTTSSCGVCGKSSIEALETGAKRIKRSDYPQVSPAAIYRLPEKLRRAQKVFDHTGGLHAAAIADARGNLIELREDVGRHNAVDKLIGAKFLANEIPLLTDKILFLSGRASFELVQKAVMARIPVIAAVGAPSSLAVDAAAEFGVTLLGFVRENRFNVYTGFERIVPAEEIKKL